MKSDLVQRDSERIHYSLASALGTDQYAKPIKMQSCNATQANKMPLKDRKAVGIWPLLLRKAEETLLFQAFVFSKMHELKSECRSVRVRGFPIVLNDPMYFADKMAVTKSQFLKYYVTVNKILLMCFTFLVLTCIFILQKQYLDLNR